MIPPGTEGTSHLGPNSRRIYRSWPCSQSSQPSCACRH
uniref:Uncharacterized protein n=1 Tax=Arundo donax TaxID=35708 RepID=A0A0A8ZDQ0_ARUDO